MAHNKIYPAPGSADFNESSELLLRLLSTLAKEQGGEIRLSRIEDRAMLSIFHDPATMEYVVRVGDVPWPPRED